jgi:hypothetical protein
LPKFGKLAIEIARNRKLLGVTMARRGAQSMPKHSKKLLLLAALCWVVPVSAHQPPVGSTQLKDLPTCPLARAKILAEAKLPKSKARTTTVIFVSRNDAIGEGPMFGSSRAFQP